MDKHVYDSAECVTGVCLYVCLPACMLSSLRCVCVWGGGAWVVCDCHSLGTWCIECNITLDSRLEVLL